MATNIRDTASSEASQLHIKTVAQKRWTKTQS